MFFFTPQFEVLPIIWIFSEGEGDGIESRLPFRIFSTLSDTTALSFYSVQKYYIFFQMMPNIFHGKANTNELSTYI